MKLLSAFAILAFSIGCSDQGPETVVGSWRLATIAGDPLPQPYDASTSLHDEVIVLEAGGTFDLLRTRVANNAPGTPLTTDCFGNWTINGNQVTLAITQACAAETFTMTWSGDTQMTRQRQGSEWIYQKE